VSDVGHRFRQKYDFGVATLDILYAYPEDSGTYECRAVNSLGSDVARTQLRCSGVCVCVCVWGGWLCKSGICNM